MTDFVTSLEFSVRTSNCLRHIGVTTEEELLALTRTQVLSIQNAGVKTWNEIAEWQNYVRKNKVRPVNHNGWPTTEDIETAVANLNSLLNMGGPEIECLSLLVRDNRVELWQRIA